MIKINLLPARRQKSRSTAPDESARPLVIGIASLIAVGAAVGLLIDRPKRAKLAELNAANAQLQNDINAKSRQLAGYAELKKAAEEADERYKSIQRLIGAKVVPAHVLHELGEREKKVIELRYGLTDGRARTLEEVGQEFGVTRERIRQIESKTLLKLRHPSRAAKLRDYLDEG